MDSGICGKDYGVMSRYFKMPFGKYKGETLEEIYIEDVGYLEWLQDQIMNKDTERMSRSDWELIRVVEINSL